VPGFTIPNDDGTAQGKAQASVDTGDIAIMVGAIALTGVVSGCAVSAQGTPNMTVAVAAGTVRIGGQKVTVAGGNVTISPADLTSPRFDLITADLNGALAKVTGSTAPQADATHPGPSFPAIPANRVVLASVYVPATDTAINANQIVQKGVLLEDQPFERPTHYGADPSLSDNGPAFQACSDALTDAGGVIAELPGLFKFQTGFTINDKGAVKVMGLAGRSNGGSAGLVLSARSPNITLVDCNQISDPAATHAAPEFYNVRFEDGTIDDLTTSSVSATWTGTPGGSGTIVFTKNGHPFKVGDTVFTSRQVGTTQFRGLVVVITTTTSSTFSGTVNDPGTAGGTGLTVSLELLFTTANRQGFSVTLLRIHGETGFHTGRCSFYGGLYGILLDTTGSVDDSWGESQECRFYFCNIGLSIQGNGGQSVVVSGGNLMMKSQCIGFQGPTDGNDCNHFRAWGMKFDTQHCSGDGGVGFDLTAANYFHLGPIDWEIEGDYTCIQVGRIRGETGQIVGQNFQHNMNKKGTGILLAGSNTGPNPPYYVDGVTVIGGQWGGVGWSEAIHIGPYCRGVKVLGGNANSASTGIVIDNATNVTGTLISGFSFFDTGNNIFSIPAGSDTRYESCYDINGPKWWDNVATPSSQLISASAMELDGSSKIAFGTAPNIIATIACQKPGSSGAYFAWEVPQDASPAQPLTVEIHWVAGSTETAKAVRWSINAKKINAGTDVTAAGTTTAFAGTNSNKTVNVSVDEAVKTVLSSVSAGDVIRVSVRRISGDASDTLTGTAYISGCSMGYTKKR
jgi:hypothetical protein